MREREGRTERGGRDGGRELEEHRPRREREVGVRMVKT